MERPQFRQRRPERSWGSVDATFSYDAYGDLTSATGTVTTPLLYGCQYLDQASGLYYLRARWYDPGTDQFLSVDPDVAETGLPYAYSGDYPVKSSDPSGLSPGMPPQGECAAEGGTWINSPTVAQSQSLWFGHCRRPTSSPSLVNQAGKAIGRGLAAVLGTGNAFAHILAGGVIIVGTDAGLSVAIAAAAASGGPEAAVELVGAIENSPFGYVLAAANAYGLALIGEGIANLHHNHTGGNHQPSGRSVHFQLQGAAPVFQNCS